MQSSASTCGCVCSLRRLFSKASDLPHIQMSTPAPHTQSTTTCTIFNHMLLPTEAADAWGEGKEKEGVRESGREGGREKGE